jgi:hypothetical protein
MPFDLANCSLVQKMSMLVLGVALLVSIAIGGFGDLMLRPLASDLVQARLPGSVAALDRILDGAEATVSPEFVGWNPHRVQKCQGAFGITGADDRKEV